MLQQRDVSSSLAGTGGSLHGTSGLTVSLNVTIATERGQLLKTKNSIYMLLSVSVVLWEISRVYLYIYLFIYKVSLVSTCCS